MTGGRRTGRPRRSGGMGKERMDRGEKDNLSRQPSDIGLLVGRAGMGISGRVTRWGGRGVGSNGFRGMRVGAGWGRGLGAGGRREPVRSE
jgi:hypothetical protein